MTSTLATSRRYTFLFVVILAVVNLGANVVVGVLGRGSGSLAFHGMLALACAIVINATLGMEHYFRVAHETLEHKLERAKAEREMAERTLAMMRQATRVEVEIMGDTGKDKGATH